MFLTVFFFLIVLHLIVVCLSFSLSELPSICLSLLSFFLKFFSPIFTNSVLLSFCLYLLSPSLSFHLSLFFRPLLLYPFFLSSASTVCHTPSFVILLSPSLCLSSLISVFFPFSSSTYIVLSFSFLHLPPYLSPSPCLSLLLSPSVTVFLLISSLSLPASSYLPIYLGLLHCLSFVSAYSAQRTPPHCKI